MTSLKTLLYWRKYFLSVKPLLVTRTITLDVDLRESIYHESGLNIHTSRYTTSIVLELTTGGSNMRAIRKLSHSTT